MPPTMPVTNQTTPRQTPGLTRSASAPALNPGRPTVPFGSAEEAWHWTMAALTARREGARFGANKGIISRPCDPDDVVRSLDQLYRQRRVSLAHARVLRVWGERQISPSASIHAENDDYRLWKEALKRLEWVLRLKGIVA